MTTVRTVGLLAIASMFVPLRARAQEPALPAPVMPPPAPPAAAAPPPPPAAAKEDETPDHDKFVGRFAVGYFGISQLPLGGLPAGNNPNAAAAIALQTVNAPIVGVRYWFQRTIGVDVGVGLGWTSGSTEAVAGNVSQSTDNANPFGFAVHAGLPISLARYKHYGFEIVPQADVGFTSETIKSPPNGNGATPPDNNLSGFLFDVGARAGAEIHFGFIGVPELSLEASVGLFVRRQTYKWSQSPDSISVGNWTLGTSVGSDPWAIFVDNISALYYF
jgi:hypothetical protein